ncbi:hypothetical protein JL721_1659 [Aureococcus anophagefferens]|nr:hypothetical protein JL721_1659 [Aureococcus anophagefferens]
MYADDVDVQRSSGDNALLERIDVRLRSDGASMTLRLACDGGKWRTSIEAWRGPMSERSRVAAAARGDSMLEIVDSARDALNDVVEAPPAAAADETVAKPEEEEESWAGALWEVTHFTGCRSWPSRRWVESGGVHVPKGATGVVAEYVDGWVRAEGSSLWMPTKGKSSSVRLVHVHKKTTSDQNQEAWKEKADATKTATKKKARADRPALAANRRGTAVGARASDVAAAPAWVDDDDGAAGPAAAMPAAAAPPPAAAAPPPAAAAPWNAGAALIRAQLARSERCLVDARLLSDAEKCLEGDCVYAPGLLAGDAFGTALRLAEELSRHASGGVVSWSRHLKHESPSFSRTFSSVVAQLSREFDVDVFATRLNFYRDGGDWKPFHRDSHAYCGDAKEDFTMGASFGDARDLAFRHGAGGYEFSFPQRDGDVFAFGSSTNEAFLHGIPKLRSKKLGGPRFSIIAWGRRRRLTSKNSTKAERDAADEAAVAARLKSQPERAVPRLQHRHLLEETGLIPHQKRGGGVGRARP